MGEPRNSQLRESDSVRHSCAQLHGCSSARSSVRGSVRGSRCEQSGASGRASAASQGASVVESEPTETEP
eukprot:CAMPEP_0117595226 /NCGR_PEP_ID=MMETSP0784-20121206/73646_1 /TAXON_ID=39447 /ORGANISM="" /LENGTH=69 /DNA_ID=CAMNT_0005397387 /DNA_START=57 /DNA_END=263 /DNA_ORIENTATION=+